MASQRERSEATRAKILEAAVRVLVDKGYAASATTRIVEEAGVSRGAMLHHFPNKALLMQEVLKHVLTVRERAFHRALQQATGADAVSDVIDAFWDAVGAEEAFVPWLELTVAARTEPSLREVVAEAASDIGRVIQQNFRELFDVEGQSRIVELLPELGMALLQGLAMRDIIERRPEQTEQVLAIVKWIASQQLAAIARPRHRD